MEKQANRNSNDKQSEEVRGEWAVLISAGNLLLISNYATAAVERLKLIVPPGARRFYRKVNAEFFTAYGLNQNQSEWLLESKLFSGAWEVLEEYRRTLLSALTLEYPEVWTVEQSQSERLPARAPRTDPPIDPTRFGLGPPTEIALSWAKSYALYCHRHRRFETTPCKDAGVLIPVPKPDKTSSDSDAAAPPRTKDNRPASYILKSPLHTLIKGQRQQTSYYMAGEKDIIRLGRDEDGEQRIKSIIQSQRLDLVLRAAKNLRPHSSFVS